MRQSEGIQRTVDLCPRNQIGDTGIEHVQHAQDVFLRFALESMLEKSGQHRFNVLDPSPEKRQLSCGKVEYGQFPGIRTRPGIGSSRALHHHLCSIPLAVPVFCSPRAYRTFEKSHSDNDRARDTFAAGSRSTGVCRETNRIASRPKTLLSAVVSFRTRL